MKRKKDEFWYCYSLRIANILIEKGFSIERTRVNLKTPKFKIFVFKKCTKLDAFLNSFFG